MAFSQSLSSRDDDSPDKPKVSGHLKAHNSSHDEAFFNMADGSSTQHRQPILQVQDSVSSADGSQNQGSRFRKQSSMKVYANKPINFDGIAS